MSEKLFNAIKNKPDLSFLKAKWPSALVARSEIGSFSGGAINARTIANLDSMGEGPENRLRIGRKVAYRVTDVIAWLESRAELVD